MFRMPIPEKLTDAEVKHDIKVTKGSRVGESGYLIGEQQAEAPWEIVKAEPLLGIVPRTAIKVGLGRDKRFYSRSGKPL